MADIKKDFVNLVLIGGQNPQILNVDFLRTNDIVSPDQPPFKELFAKNKPFTKFVSTPVFANLVLENIEFTVDEQRFMIRDRTIDGEPDPFGGFPGVLIIGGDQAVGNGRRGFAAAMMERSCQFAGGLSTLAGSGRHHLRRPVFRVAVWLSIAILKVRQWRAHAVPAAAETMPADRLPF